MSGVDAAEPFLRWAGGKRWLAGTLSPLLRTLLSGGGTYYEPFLGAGAVYFALAPARAILSDVNLDLISTYGAVRDAPAEVLDLVRSWPVDPQVYYNLRGHRFADPVQSAARFVYLNRTCYGGLHRTNKAGLFNVPYGGGSRTTAALWQRDLVARASRTLRSDVRLFAHDFEAIVDRAKRGDVVYCDPTYSGVRRDQFDRYGAAVFSWNDQERLAVACRRAQARGATVLVSNGSHPEIASLFAGALAFDFVKKKTIGNKALADAAHHESLFVLGGPRDPAFWVPLAAAPDPARGILAPQLTQATLEAS